MAAGVPREGEPLYPLTRGLSKALLPVAGKSMLQWVLEALAAARSIGRVVVVGPRTDLPFPRELHYLEGGGDYLANLRAGARRLLELDPGVERLLVVSADIPALTSEHVDWIVAQAQAGDHDLCYCVIDRQAMEAAFPGCRRTFYRFRDREVCGGDLGRGPHLRLRRGLEDLAEAHGGAQEPLEDGGGHRPGGAAALPAGPPEHRRGGARGQPPPGHPRAGPGLPFPGGGHGRGQAVPARPGGGSAAAAGEALILEGLRRLDARATTWLRSLLRGPGARAALSVAAHSGDSLVLVPLLVLLWWLQGFSGRSLAVPLAAAYLLSVVLTTLLKYAVRRRRPAGEWGAMYRRTDPHSFPSGHASRTAALTVVVLARGVQPGCNPGYCPAYCPACCWPAGPCWWASPA